MHPFIETQKEWLRDNLPPFRAGDTLRVNVRVKEGEKERIQAFEGVCIARRARRRRGAVGAAHGHPEPAAADRRRLGGPLTAPCERPRRVR